MRNLKIKIFILIIFIPIAFPVMLLANDKFYFDGHKYYKLTLVEPGLNLDTKEFYSEYEMKMVDGVEKQFVKRRLKVVILDFIAEKDYQKETDNFRNIIKENIAFSTYYNIVSDETLKSALAIEKMDLSDFDTQKSRIEFAKQVNADLIIYGNLLENTNERVLSINVVNRFTGMLFKSNSFIDTNSTRMQEKVEKWCYENFPIEGKILQKPYGNSPIYCSLSQKNGLKNSSYLYSDLFDKNGTLKSVLEEDLQILKVYRDLSPIVDEQTDKIIGYNRQEVGLMAVSSVYEDKSAGYIIGFFNPTNTMLKAGDYVVLVGGIKDIAGKYNIAKHSDGSTNQTSYNNRYIYLPDYILGANIMVGFNFKDDLYEGLEKMGDRLGVELDLWKMPLDLGLNAFSALLIPDETTMLSMNIAEYKLKILGAKSNSKSEFTCIRNTLSFEFKIMPTITISRDNGKVGVFWTLNLGPSFDNNFLTLGYKIKDDTGNILDELEKKTYYSFSLRGILGTGFHFFFDKTNLYLGFNIDWYTPPTGNNYASSGDMLFYQKDGDFSFGEYGPEGSRPLELDSGAIYFSIMLSYYYW